jgi:hypothetical protein
MPLPHKISRKNADGINLLQRSTGEADRSCMLSASMLSSQCPYVAFACLAKLAVFGECFANHSNSRTRIYERSDFYRKRAFETIS